jgi:hypothetical protein
MIFDNISDNIALKAQKKFRLDQDPAGSVICWPPGFGSFNRDFGSADPDPKKNFTNPQH